MLDPKQELENSVGQRLPSGRAVMTVDGREVIAGAGDIVVIGPETSHSFVAVGEKRLDMVCIHASERFIIRPKPALGTYS